MFEIYYKKNDNNELFSKLKNMESNITNLQNYVPIYKRFFSLNETNYNLINLNHKYSISDIKKKHNYNHYTVLLKEDDDEKEKFSTKLSFFKYSPIIDSIKYLTGVYNKKERIIELPKLNNDHCFKKISDFNNSAYIDSFFCYLSSQLLNKHGFIHGIDFYGSFLGIKKEFYCDVEEEAEGLLNNDFFDENCGKLFELHDVGETFFGSDTRKHRNKIFIKEDE